MATAQINSLTNVLTIGTSLIIYGTYTESFFPSLIGCLFPFRRGLFVPYSLSDYVVTCVLQPASGPAVNPVNNTVYQDTSTGFWWAAFTGLADTVVYSAIAKASPISSPGTGNPTTIASLTADQNTRVSCINVQCPPAAAVALNDNDTIHSTRPTLTGSCAPAANSSVACGFFKAAQGKAGMTATVNAGAWTAAFTNPIPVDAGYFVHSQLKRNGYTVAGTLKSNITVAAH
jgi:hypothetical protein